MSGEYPETYGGLDVASQGRRRALQAEAIACAKAVRQERVCCVQGSARRPVG